MLKTERFFRTLVLVSFFSFILYQFSAFSLVYLSELIFLLEDTAFVKFISIVDLLLRIIFVVLKYVSRIFFIGALVGLIVIFFKDLVIDPVRKEKNLRLWYYLKVKTVEYKLKDYLEGYGFNSHTSK